MMSKTHLIPVTVHHVFYVQYETDTSDPVEAAELASEDPDLYDYFPDYTKFTEVADAWWDVTVTAEDANHLFKHGHHTDTMLKHVVEHGGPEWDVTSD